MFFCIRASSMPSTRASASTRECLASASASTRVLVHASSLFWGGVESALSGHRENTFGRLGESAGARLRCWGEARRECGGSEGAETLRAWRARRVQGAYSVRTCAVRSAWARPPRESVECSERSSTCV